MTAGKIEQSDSIFYYFATKRKTKSMQGQAHTHTHAHIPLDIHAAQCYENPSSEDVL